MGRRICRLHRQGKAPRLGACDALSWNEVRARAATFAEE